MLKWRDRTQVTSPLLRAVAFQQPMLLRCVAESLNESRSLCVGRLEEFVVFT